jgi:hypothetical protein
MSAKVDDSTKTAASGKDNGLAAGSAPSGRERPLIARPIPNVDWKKLMAEAETEWPETLRYLGR